MVEYKVDILTGVRPTAALTVANYLGAVKHIVDLQKKTKNIVIFVADLHAITDHEPSEVTKHINEVVADYIALGVDPNRAIIYKQSDIAGEVATLSLFLARHTTVAELLRIPTLKEKLKGERRPEAANALLFFYPIMMAADILVQRAHFVPVGEDQLPHIEITRKLAKKFNKKYKKIFPIPNALKVKTLRILSLRGEGKMSKTTPAGAIFLSDTPEEAAYKIKKAETALEGQMTEKLESHILLAYGLANNPDDKKAINEIIERHKKGEQVMGEFKKVLTKIVQEFLTKFQQKRNKISDKEIEDILERGARKACENAQETIELLKEAVKF